MDSSINAVLERARSLRDLGRYSDAVQELEGSLETCDPNLELAVELGESLSVQGYFGRAVTLLERHMVHMEEVGNLYAISGILICCCARFRVTCQFQKSVRPVERSYQTFLSSQSSEIVCYESVSLVLLLTKSVVETLIIQRSGLKSFTQYSGDWCKLSVAPITQTF